MKIVHGKTRHALTLIAAATLALSAVQAFAKDIKITLSGAEETPPVTTSATGVGTISVAKDHTVTGSIKTTGIEGVAAHIHVGPTGVAGPPIIPLTKGADGTWTVPEGAKLVPQVRTCSL